MGKLGREAARAPQHTLWWILEHPIVPEDNATSLYSSQLKTWQSDYLSMRKLYAGGSEAAKFRQLTWADLQVIVSLSQNWTDLSAKDKQSAKTCKDV